MPTGVNFPLLAAWFVLRQWGRKPWRCLAVALGVGLGASVFLSVRLAADACGEAFRRNMDAFTGTASVAVSSPGARVDERLVAALLAHPAVRHASPVLSAYVAGPDGRPLRMVGIDPLLDRPFRLGAAPGGQPSLDWLSLMARPDTMVLGQAAAKRLGLAPGDPAPLRASGREARFTVLGVLDAQGLGGVESGDLAVADIATVQEFLGVAGLVDRIDVILAPGYGPDALSPLLPPGVRAAPPGEARESGLAMIGAYQLNLTVLSFVSLFVGMFLVYSLVSLDAAARRKELAVLRSLGAGPGMVTSLVLFQGAALGALGWLIGMPVAALSTDAMLSGVASTVNNLFVRVAVGEARLDPAEVATSLAVTLAISLLASAGPALRSMRVPPREAMAIHAAEERSPRRARTFTSLCGLAFCLAAWPVSGMPSPPGFALTGYLAILSLFIGLALLAPAALRATALALAPLARLGGAPAMLANAQGARGQDRASVAVGALATAMALFLALSTMVHSFRAGFLTWLDQTVTGDLFLRPAMAELNGYRDALPDGLERWLLARGDVEVVEYLRRHMTLGRVPFQFEATDMGLLMRLSSFTVLDALPDAPGLLESGRGVAVAEALATQAGLKPGDRFRVQVGAARLDVPVAAVVRSYRTRGGEAYFDIGAFRALGGEPGAGGYRVYFKDRSGDIAARAEALQADLLSGPYGPAIEAVPGPSLHRIVTSIFDDTFAITGVLLMVALGVAALGVSVTLTVRVLERSRQLSTLFALGASGGQMARMVLFEALHLGLAGLALGIAGGAGLAAILVYSVNRQSFGWTFPYLTDWRALAFSLPLVLAAVLLAGPPACRAALSRPPALALRER